MPRPMAACRYGLPDRGGDPRYLASLNTGVA